ncbi:MAG: hypothetical protein PHE33_02895 [Bacteroidales bacterium]|nr:hypothetical protein [Bacteroidales bacterium]
MNYNKILILFLISIFTVLACSTDVDVTGDATDIPIVYCVLDQSADYQYVKVNKTFLGPVPASQMAQISDSLFYENVVVKLHEIKNNYVTQSWTFSPVDTIVKPSGYFANDKNTIWVGSPNLDPEATYQLEVNINNGQHIITGETALIDGVRIKIPNPYVLAIDVVNYDGDFPYEYINGLNGKIFQMNITFNYLNVINGDTVGQMISIPWPQGKEYRLLETSTEVVGKFSISAFYNLLVANIPPPGDTVRLVKMPNSIVFTLSTADENYSTYMDATSPSQGIVQEKPSFTNINGGYGLFASRFNTSISKPLGGRTLDSINRGIYTKNLGFANRYNLYYQGWY